MKASADTGRKCLVDFDRFWAEYPKKIGKAAARRAWTRMKPPIDAALNTVRVFRDTQAWTREGGRFIPYPATWINRGGWEDQAPAESLLDDVSARTRKLVETREEWLEENS